MVRRIILATPWDFAGWRAAARALARAGVAPQEIVWSVADAPADLLSQTHDDLPKVSAQAEFSVPRAFLALAETAAIHSDPERFALLYQCLWRLRQERGLLEVAVDPLIARLEAMAKSVRRDIHKMHAFVRFREVSAQGTVEGSGEGASHFIAWFEPEHHIVEAAAPFFERRFASMHWTIMTPEQCAHWDGAALTYTPGLAKPAGDIEDVAEDLWRTYYASIFNPARLKVDAMRSEMPQKYWRNLPEAALIKPLIDGAARRTHEMIAAVPQAPKVNRQMRIEKPPTDPAQLQAGEAVDLASLRREAGNCRACPLWEPATQIVFGEGPEDATILFVGEQPGDQEDIAGKPFVGPAGQLLSRAMAEAGVDRKRAYVTNAVKHFKFEPRGKRRIHQKPNTGEIQTCRWWVEREIDIVKPQLVVALGATAVMSIFRETTAISKLRGRFIDRGDAPTGFVTVHPSYLLRLPDEAAKAAEYARFVEDLRIVTTRQQPVAAP